MCPDLTVDQGRHRRDCSAGARLLTGLVGKIQVVIDPMRDQHADRIIERDQNQHPQRQLFPCTGGYVRQSVARPVADAGKAARQIVLNAVPHMSSVCFSCHYDDCIAVNEKSPHLNRDGGVKTIVKVRVRTLLSVAATARSLDSDHLGNTAFTREVGKHRLYEIGHDFRHPVIAADADSPSLK